MTRLGLCLLTLVALTGAYKKQGACFSKSLGRYFYDGDKWTEPKCTQAQCNQGEIVRLPCGLLAVPIGCKLVRGDSGAPYPGCCSKVVCPKRCFSKGLKRYFKETEKWTEPPCNRGVCRNGIVGIIPCPLIRPGPGCVVVKGKPGAPYPGCCVSFKCPKPGQCYSKGLDKFFDDGAEWTEPPCQKNKCVKGKVIGLPCGLQGPLRPGCQLVKGKPGAPYPECCLKTVCKCYSKALKRYFNDGDIWTEPPCTQVKCENGNVAALTCPAILPGPGCVAVKGKPGAPYPGCCTSFKCPKPGQCYSKGLDKFFDDGAWWTEPPCSRFECKKGDVSGLGCPVTIPSPNCRLTKGQPGAVYPKCCPKTICDKPLQCFSKSLKEYFSDGAEWTEPKCVRARCSKGKTVRRSCPRISLLSSKSLCEVVAGQPGAPYPGCCRKVICKKTHRCFSEKLRKYFSNGQTWFEGTCVRARCVNGRIKRKFKCPSHCRHGKCKSLPYKKKFGFA